VTSHPTRDYTSKCWNKRYLKNMITETIKVVQKNTLHTDTFHSGKTVKLENLTPPQCPSKNSIPYTFMKHLITYLRVSRLEDCGCDLVSKRHQNIFHSVSHKHAIVYL
jgi:hypothetical protein